MCLYSNDCNERELHHTYVTLKLSSARLKGGPLRGWVLGGGHDPRWPWPTAA